MMGRCYRKTHHAYADYGGRGISVCEEWQSCESFVRWAETLYAPGLTLDRIDNDKNYSPSNCRWATKKGQANNRRSTVTATAFGESRPLGEWASDTRCNVSYGQLWKRYKRFVQLGRISMERAIQTPPRRLAMS
jgi:hypothetical protein